MAPMAEADCSGRRRRFAVACSVLSRCVRADAVAAKMVAAAARHTTSEAPAAQHTSTMLLMPGVEVAREETAAAPAPGQLRVVYGGRVLVFDDVPADRAAAVMCVARQEVLNRPADLQLQVARKASLQRLMEKRRDRLEERAPYAPARLAAMAPKRGQEEGDAGTWLGLGLPGGRAC